jgi:hypothetical protein
VSVLPARRAMIRKISGFFAFTIAFCRAMTLFDIAVVSASCSAYGVALFSTAIRSFWTGPNFVIGPLSGWDCLTSGCFYLQIGWLANPVLFVGEVLLLSRYRIAAFLLAIGSLGWTCLWTIEFCREFSANLLEDGYYWWLSSMLILLVGAFCSLVVHHSEARRSLRLFWQTC